MGPGVGGALLLLLLLLPDIPESTDAPDDVTLPLARSKEGAGPVEGGDSY